MVLKKSNKKGLNTGNTVRNSKLAGRLECSARYGFLKANSTATYQLKHQSSEIDDLVPTSWVEFSLNKKKRWETTQQLRELVLEDSSENEVSGEQGLLEKWLSLS